MTPVEIIRAAAKRAEEDAAYRACLQSFTTAGVLSSTLGPAARHKDRHGLPSALSRLADTVERNGFDCSRVEVAPNGYCWRVA